jgi:salicylate hydroxylase
MFRNGRSGEELHRREKTREGGGRAPIRTQRTKLQSALLSQILPGTIQLSKKLSSITDLGTAGVQLTFQDTTTATADLVVGADGIRSVRCSPSTSSPSPINSTHRQSATQPGPPTR